MLLRCNQLEFEPGIITSALRQTVKSSGFPAGSAGEWGQIFILDSSSSFTYPSTASKRAARKKRKRGTVVDYPFQGLMGEFGVKLSLIASKTPFLSMQAR